VQTTYLLLGGVRVVEKVLANDELVSGRLGTALVVEEGAAQDERSA
jgi:hypothetical protein